MKHIRVQNYNVINIESIGRIVVTWTKRKKKREKHLGNGRAKNGERQGIKN